MENTTCACEILSEKLTKAEQNINDLEVRLKVVEDKLKVADLTGKGDRYETKLLAPKNVAADLGGGAEVDKIKPEHCTAEELFAEIPSIEPTRPALQKLIDKISCAK